MVDTRRGGKRKENERDDEEKNQGKKVKVKFVRKATESSSENKAEPIKFLVDAAVAIDGERSGVAENISWAEARETDEEQQEGEKGEEEGGEKGEEEVDDRDDNANKDHEEVRNSDSSDEEVRNYALFVGRSTLGILSNSRCNSRITE